MAIRKNPISVEEACYWFAYDPDSGELSWKRKKKCNTVGRVFKSRVINIRENYALRTMQKTRVIWMVHTGEPPPPMIDHINGDRDDNRWVNLRASDAVTNQYNRHGHGKYPKGVSYHARDKSKPWRATITTPEGFKNIGNYASMEEAKEAYEKIARDLHGEFHVENRK